MRSKPRPVFTNVNVFADLPSYRLPAAGIVSILHRISGLLMFLLLPFVVWLFDTSVTSEISFESFRSAFEAGIGFVPAAVVKLVCVALVWAYVHHLVAGLRHLWMDATHSTSKVQGRRSAYLVFVVSLPITLAAALKLFNVY